MTRGVLLSLLAAAVLPWLPLPSEAQTPSRPEILSLHFEGNESFPDRMLRNAILTRETECRSFVFQVVPFCPLGAEFAIDRSYMNPRVFDQDFIRVQLFYFIRGFREAQVDTVIDRVDDTRVRVTYHIDEGRPIVITRLGVTGLGDANEEDRLARTLPIGPGEPLSLRQLDVARDTLIQRMRNRGYAHADVLRQIGIDSTGYLAEVEFDIYTGTLARYGPIRIVGNDEVSETVIRRMLPFQEGEIYSQEEIFEGQRNLYNLDIFRHAAIAQDLDHHPDSIVPLEVQVNEGNTHRVRAGGGWNSAECFLSEGRWVSRNFRGGARRLVVRGRLSNLGTHQLEESICAGAGTGVYGDVNWSVSTDFTQPWIFSPRNSFTGSVYAERQSLQDVFVRRAVGLNLTLTRTLGRGTLGSAFYRPQLGQLDAAEVFFCTTFLVCDPQQIDVLQSSNRLAPAGLSFSRDRTDRAFSPRDGYTLAADVEHASRITGSHFGYDRVVAEVTSFRGVGEDLVLAGRLRAGRLNAREFRGLGFEDGSQPRIAHPQRRFYAGGANSVRGYAESQLGPRVVSVEVTDLVFPVGDRVEAVCTPEEVAVLACDAGPLGEGRFFSRPTGGDNLVEGSLELRFPVHQPHLRGAAFVDFGQVWDAQAETSLRDVRFTPGVGLRYSTPIGPVRVDLAYRPPRTERVPVITSALRPFDPDRDRPGDRLLGPDGERIDWVALDELALLGPRLPLEEEQGFSWRRLQLHFSIGQAF
jgi:outer membrane protein assembly factor BamA